MKEYPVIGIISGKHDVGYVLPVYAMNSHYLEQVAAAGAVPVQIPMVAGMEDGPLLEQIRRCDGFLLPGGGDFDSDWYGETLLPNLSPDSMAIDRQSQETALRFIRLAVASGKPVLGICLGMQVLNVALGGSLYQDIATQIPSAVPHRNPAKVMEDRWKPAHTVRLAEDGVVRRLSGKEEISVNSFHHQAVKAIAEGLRPTAWAPDGLVEAVESGDGRVLGVQWHPENLAYAGDPYAAAMFRWLTEAAKA